MLCLKLSRELLGPRKALLPRNRNRKIETSEEMDYAEIKAHMYIWVLRSINNRKSAASRYYWFNEYVPSSEGQHWIS